MICLKVGLTQRDERGGGLLVGTGHVRVTRNAIGESTAIIASISRDLLRWIGLKEGDQRVACFVAGNVVIAFGRPSVARRRQRCLIIYGKRQRQNMAVLVALHVALVGARLRLQSR